MPAACELISMMKLSDIAASVEVRADNGGCAERFLTVSRAARSCHAPGLTRERCRHHRTCPGDPRPCLVAAKHVDGWDKPGQYGNRSCGWRKRRHPVAIVPARRVACRRP